MHVTVTTASETTIYVRVLGLSCKSRTAWDNTIGLTKYTSEFMNAALLSARNIVDNRITGKQPGIRSEKIKIDWIGVIANIL